jgi:hypothetical protein
VSRCLSDTKHCVASGIEFHVANLYPIARMLCSDFEEIKLCEKRQEELLLFLV